MHGNFLLYFSPLSLFSSYGSDKVVSSLCNPSVDIFLCMVIINFKVTLVKFISVGRWKGEKALDIASAVLLVATRVVWLHAAATTDVVEVDYCEVVQTLEGYRVLCTPCIAQRQGWLIVYTDENSQAKRREKVCRSREDTGTKQCSGQGYVSCIVHCFVDIRLRTRMRISRDSQFIRQAHRKGIRWLICHEIYSLELILEPTNRLSFSSDEWVMNHRHSNWKRTYDTKHWA